MIDYIFCHKRHRSYSHGVLTHHKESWESLSTGRHNLIGVSSNVKTINCLQGSKVFINFRYD